MTLTPLKIYKEGRERKKEKECTQLELEVNNFEASLSPTPLSSPLYYFHSMLTNPFVTITL
jgi:hypothetical protein